jgi:peptide chain release factor 1
MQASELYLRQHVNKTESAVRLTHEPSGIVVSMQDERSQHRVRSSKVTTFPSVTSLHCRIERKLLLYSKHGCYIVNYKKIKLPTGMSVVVWSKVLIGVKKSEHTTSHRCIFTFNMHHIDYRLMFQSQNRVTDHRIGMTINNIHAVLEGGMLQEFLSGLRKNFEQAWLESHANDIS